jgi:glutamate dehydrogenase (NADP+)
MLNNIGDSLEGKTCVVSGSGNVATYTVEKATEMGGRVVTMSDSSGFVHDPEGIDAEKLAWIKELKEVRRGRISEYADKFSSATFHGKERPWGVTCDVAFPCANAERDQSRRSEDPAWQRRPGGL